MVWVSAAWSLHYFPQTPVMMNILTNLLFFQQEKKRSVVSQYPFSNNNESSGTPNQAFNVKFTFHP